MMRRETAYRLAGRNHHHEDVLDDAQRIQDIRFASPLGGQSERALSLLTALPGLGVSRCVEPDRIQVRYDLAHYTLRWIESYLEEQGACLDASLLSRIKRTLVYFCEDTLTRNAKAPQRLIKQSNQVYVKAYEHHQHGDHDDTPPELREYK